MESPKLLKGVLKLFPFEFHFYFNISLELVKLNFGFHLEYPKKGFILSHPNLERVLVSYIKELKEYFEGRISFLNPPHHLNLKPFSLRVLELLREIPKGKTITYTELAQKANLPYGARAVAKILALNPLPLLYPCHRVVSKKGLSGFSQGTLLKWLLLYWEGQYQKTDKNLLKSKL
ncbi:MAG: methylated-DNA--[protein]-cysteine S-methyltransferase [Caldimicrobium sp.]